MWDGKLLKESGHQWNPHWFIGLLLSIAVLDFEWMHQKVVVWWLRWVLGRIGRVGLCWWFISSFIWLHDENGNISSRQRPQIVRSDYSMSFHPFGLLNGLLESSNLTLFNHMGTSHFSTSYSIRSCSFL